MYISEMITHLKFMLEHHGDCEITVTDGFNGCCYRKNEQYDYDINMYEMLDENGDMIPYVDIGIGGCIETVDNNYL